MARLVSERPDHWKVPDSGKHNARCTGRCTSSTHGCVGCCAPTTRISVCPATSDHSKTSAPRCAGYGIECVGVAVNAVWTGRGTWTCYGTFYCLLHALHTRRRRALVDSGYPRQEPYAGKPHLRIREGKSRTVAVLDQLVLKEVSLQSRFMVSTKKFKNSGASTPTAAWTLRALSPSGAF